jgi:hypothetical protein
VVVVVVVVVVDAICGHQKDPILAGTNALLFWYYIIMFVLLRLPMLSALFVFVFLLM